MSSPSRAFGHLNGHASDSAAAVVQSQPAHVKVSMGIPRAR